MGNVMEDALANRLGNALRAADPDRYFASLFAPAAFARIFSLFMPSTMRSRASPRRYANRCSGAIRLEWWRETAEGCGSGYASQSCHVARGWRDCSLPIA